MKISQYGLTYVPRWRTDQAYPFDGDEVWELLNSGAVEKASNMDGLDIYYHDRFIGEFYTREGQIYVRGLNGRTITGIRFKSIDDIIGYGKLYYSENCI